MRGFDITSIAIGAHHSLAFNSKSRVFVFDDNSASTPTSTRPSRSSTLAQASPSPHLGRLTSVAAGGASFFTVDRAQFPRAKKDPPTSRCITADTWTCGQSILGILGTGRWMHQQAPYQDESAWQPC